MNCRSQSSAVVSINLLLALAAACSAVVAQAQEGPPPAAAGDGSSGVLVLRNGGVLFGQATLHGDRYLVNGRGGQLHVPAANVLLVAESLDDAYEQRRERFARPTAEAHLALAEWCLRHDLLLQARRELDAAREVEPLHPRLAFLERRLALAAERTRKSTQPADLATATFEPDGPPAPQISGTDAYESAALPLSRSAALPPDLPSGALERFTRRVQPILVNNCTASGCHQPGGPQQFQLDRSILHRMANRRTTMNNLAATLALVDRERPRLSPLLTIPRQPHAGMKAAIFGPRQEAAFGHLVEWVALVTQSEPWDEDADGTGGEHSDANEDEDDVAMGVELDAAAGLLPVPRLQYGVELQSWQPRDPFDPEIFNRQQRRDRNMHHAAETNVPVESD